LAKAQALKQERIANIIREKALRMEAEEKNEAPPTPNKEVV
jgi:hypothetical protein